MAIKALVEKYSVMKPALVEESIVLTPALVDALRAGIWKADKMDESYVQKVIAIIEGAGNRADDVMALRWCAGRNRGSFTEEGRWAALLFVEKHLPGSI